MEAQGLIKILDAAYTWPHPTEPGYHVAGIFVRTDNNEPYLIYCPKLRAEMSINEEECDFLSFWNMESIQKIRKVELHQGMYQVDDVLFMIIPLSKQKPKEIKKSEIEKMFGIKVVE